MSTPPAPRPSVAPQAVMRSGAGRRSPDSADRLRRVIDRLDTLLRDVTIGARSHREHESHVAVAEAAAAELIATFRAPTPAQAPVHPPLWQQGGKALW